MLVFEKLIDVYYRHIIHLVHLKTLTFKMIFFL